MSSSNNFPRTFPLSATAVDFRQPSWTLAKPCPRSLRVDGQALEMTGEGLRLFGFRKGRQPWAASASPGGSPRKEGAVGLVAYATLVWDSVSKGGRIAPPAGLDGTFQSLA